MTEQPANLPGTRTDEPHLASSSDRPCISVIVPTLDEGGNIGPLIDRLLAEPALAGRVEIVVADDGSTDSTVDEVQARATGGDVRLLRRSGRPDLTASVLEAARVARGEFCVVMDADGSHPVEAVGRLLAPLENGRADVAVGSRHVDGGAIADWPAWRRLTSRAAALLAWPFTRVRDPMSGFFATTRERLASLDPLEAGYKVLIEVLVRTRPDPRVVEVPFRFNDRDTGTSKMTARVQWLFVRRLAALGGARMTLGNLSRFSLVGLSGVGVDLAVFWLLRSLEAGLATAHFGSFFVATVSNFALNYRWSFAREFEQDRPVLGRYGAFLVVALLALVIRGGVLAALTQGLSLDAAAAIVPAVALTAVINYFGSVFYVFPARDAENNPEIRWRMAALGLIACSLAMRWLYLGQAELIFDEMYYWVYTLHPALSYLDHPPLTSWLIGIGSALLGDNAFGVRVATLVLAPAAIAFAYLYCRDVYDKTRGLLGAMLVATVPAWLAAGFLMTTDAPVLVAWLAALYFLRRALVEGDERAWWGAGVAIGLGALAKYTIAFLAPAVVVFMLLHASARAQLLRWRTWAGAAVALALFSPVLVWNAGHDWASFAFQSTRRIAEEPQITTHWLPLHTIVGLAPLAGLLALWLLGPARKRYCRRTPDRAFMMAMTLTPLAITAAFGLFTELKVHWVVPMWLGVLPMIAATVHPPDHVPRTRTTRALTTLWRPLLPLSLVVAGMGLHYVSIGLPGVQWQPNRLGYMGWPELAQEVHRIEQRIEAETGKRPVIAGMAKWGIASALTFHDVDGRVDNITARNLVGMSGSQWERWFDPETDPDRPVLLVSHEAKLIDESWLEGAVIGLGPLETRTVYRDDMPIQRLHFRIADGFRPEQLRYPGHIPE
ncbi:MAG: glycosyltransferase family 39 protein [Candidatus Wenzhouxiangella sp. M2_3B_020]